MCGIAGIKTDPYDPDAGRHAALMAATLAHRGPDGQGLWEDEAGGLALGHTRLAVRDLAPAGAQPMVCESGRFAIAYNGELYNAEEMRADLPGRIWRGHSDTEVLLEHCARFGIRASLERTNGIFAFALWDRESRTLWLARDRLGVKPLYWSALPGLFLFGSELRALAAHPRFPRQLDRHALSAFMRLSYVPAPLAIWQAARKLEPGQLLVHRSGDPPRLEFWWDSAQAIQGGLRRQGRQSLGALEEELDGLLADAIGRQTVADVGLGAFLSGGVDSSTVVAYLAMQAKASIETFTVRFAEGGYDEGEDAARIARHLGTRHHETIVTAKDALALIDELPQIYDEPFADSSQLPSILIARFARHHVTVALSGDGGDELFAGYNRHVFAARLWPALRAFPRPLRAGAARLLNALPPNAWDRLGHRLGLRLLGEKVQKLADVLPETSLTAIHARLCAQGQPATESLLADPILDHDDDEDGFALGEITPLDRMQARDLRHYLPDDVLTKVDRASMACGLEVRVPLLDHRLLEVAFAATADQRIRLGKGKQLLRRVLGRHLPASLFATKAKMGFAAPIDSWLRGPLKDWARDLLDPEHLGRQGLFNPRAVARCWQDHCDGRRKHHHTLWNVLIFQAWSGRGDGSAA